MLGSSQNRLEVAAVSIQPCHTSSITDPSLSEPRLLAVKGPRTSMSPMLFSSPSKGYRKKTMSPRTLTFTGSSLLESVNLIVQDRVVGPANPTLTSDSPKGRSVKLAPPFVTNALRNEVRQTKAPAPAGGVNDAVWFVGRPGFRLFGPPSLKKSNANGLTPTIAVMGRTDPTAPVPVSRGTT